MFEADIERTTCELRAEADIDFFDVSLIAESLREDLDLRTQGEIRRCTLDVIGRLMARGVYPGDYDHATTMRFWPGEPEALLKRIEAEWIAIGTTPTLDHPGSASSDRSRSDVVRPPPIGSGSFGDGRQQHAQLPGHGVGPPGDRPPPAAGGARPADRPLGGDRSGGADLRVPAALADGCGESCGRLAVNFSDIETAFDLALARRKRQMG